jgi:hypothetical protein
MGWLAMLGLAIVAMMVGESVGGALSKFFGALREWFAGAATPLPLLAVWAAAALLGWLGWALGRAARTDGERLAGAAVFLGAAFVALVAAFTWRDARRDRRDDHWPRG